MERKISVRGDIGQNKHKTKGGVEEEIVKQMEIALFSKKLTNITDTGGIVMRKRKLVLSIVMSIVFVSTLALPCWAIAPSTQLHIGRASDGSLWKMTCIGLTCTGFTSFPGNFASQPSVTWDESIKRYVLVGVAAGGSIWRSTFDAYGTFQDDWVNIPGVVASPLGSASGDLFESQVWYSSTSDTTYIGTTCTNYSGGIVTVDAPLSGVVVVEADVIVSLSHTNGTQDLARIFIGEFDSDCSSPHDNNAWINISASEANLSTYHSVHLTRSFTVAAGSKTFYLNGLMAMGQNATDAFFYANMKAVYYPY
jgi:hypothetical protein